MSEQSDSIVYKDSNGFIGIGTNNPTSLLTFPPGTADFGPGGSSTRDLIEIPSDRHSSKFKLFNDDDYSNSRLTIKNFSGATGTHLMTWSGNGRIGIGTNDPKGALHIVGGPTNTFAPSGTYYWGAAYLHNGGVASSWSGMSGTQNTYGSTTGLVVEHNVMAGVYHTFSDKRIKTEIEDVPDNLALSQVNNLECKYYNYKDVRQKRQNKVIGFIAQEVKDVIPNAVSINFGFIPDEMRIIENPIWDDNKLIIDDIDLSGNHTGNCKFYVSNDPSGNDEIMIDVMVEEDKKSFIFDKNWNNVFLWGKEVDDFHSIDKNMIFALHHSAIQELSRQNDAKDKRITELEDEIKKIKEHIGMT